MNLSRFSCGSERTICSTQGKLSRLSSDSGRLVPPQRLAKSVRQTPDFRPLLSVGSRASWYSGQTVERSTDLIFALDVEWTHLGRKPSQRFPAEVCALGSSGSVFQTFCSPGDTRSLPGTSSSSGPILRTPNAPVEGSLLHWSITGQAKGMIASSKTFAEQTALCRIFSLPS